MADFSSRQPRSDTWRQIGACIAALNSISEPADLALNRWFRSNRSVGQRDRAVIMEFYYAYLKRRALIEALASSLPLESGGHARRYALAMQKGVQSYNQPSDLSAAEQLWWQQSLSDFVKARPDCVELTEHLPSWLFGSVRASLGEVSAHRFAVNQLEMAPVDIRVNLSRIPFKRVLAELDLREIGYEILNPKLGAIRLATRAAVKHLEGFAQGWFEVQDHGSQCIARAVAARRGQTIVDFCAGAGGKSLAIADAMRGKGRVYALDTEHKRLLRLKERAHRAGFQSISTLVIEHEQDQGLARLFGRADAVLVDAPCSGTGTLRRQPEIKWRLKPEELERLQSQQLSILCSAARLVRSGGFLVYATCSVLEQENTRVVELFLEQNSRFSSVSLPSDLLGSWGDEGPCVDAFQGVQYWPHLHRNDGFYLVRFQAD